MNYFINPLRKYAIFKGRASKKEYWMFVFYYFIIFFILIIFAPNSFSSEIIYTYILAMAIPIYSAGARRLHDTNRSALWLFASFVPILNIIVLVFLAMDGNVGDNKYGAEPKNLI